MRERCSFDSILRSSDPRKSFHTAKTRSGHPHLCVVRREIKVAAESESCAGFVERYAFDVA